MFKVTKDSKPDSLEKECNSKWEFYIKKTPVKVMLMDKPFMVETLEGTLEGKAGDYLSVGPKGEFYPIDKGVMKKSYEKVEFPKTECETCGCDDGDTKTGDMDRKRIRDPEKKLNEKCKKTNESINKYLNIRNKNLDNIVNGYLGLNEHSFNSIVMDSIICWIKHEGYIFGDKTIAVNLDKFKNGKFNKLLILGVCGSGKTTLSEYLSNTVYKNIKWRSIDSMYWRIQQEHFKGVKRTPEIQKEIIRLVKKDTIELLKNSERWIIEGADLIDIYKEYPQYRKLILNQSMIILGMSSLESGIKAGIRNMKRQGGEGWREMYWMVNINIKELQGPLNLIRKDVKNLPNVKIEEYNIPKL